MPEINYKAKYEQLKQRYMNDLDVAFRLGVEQGMQQAQVEQAQEAAAQAQAQAEAAANGGMSGQDGEQGAPGEEGGEEQGAPGEQPGNTASAHPDGSELDQHIAELEGLLGKTEYGTEQYEMLKKSLDGVKSLRNGIKLKSDLAKGDAAIKVIAKALGNDRGIKVMSKQASHNLSSNAKAAVSMQQKIVDEVMKSWNDEANGAAKIIQQIVNQEGASKKE